MKTKTKKRIRKAIPGLSAKEAARLNRPVGPLQLPQVWRKWDGELAMLPLHTTFRGDWSPTKVYAPGDIVAHPEFGICVANFTNKNTEPNPRQRNLGTGTSCEQCRWFLKVAATELGYCRRFPPQLHGYATMRVSAKGITAPQGDFPLVNTTDWCGEFQPL